MAKRKQVRQTQRALKKLMWLFTHGYVNGETTDDVFRCILSGLFDNANGARDQGDEGVDSR